MQCCRQRRGDAVGSQSVTPYDADVDNNGNNKSIETITASEGNNSKYDTTRLVSVSEERRKKRRLDEINDTEHTLLMRIPHFREIY